MYSDAMWMWIILVHSGFVKFEIYAIWNVTKYVVMYVIFGLCRKIQRLADTIEKEQLGLNNWIYFLYHSFVLRFRKSE